MKSFKEQEAELEEQLKNAMLDERAAWEVVRANKAELEIVQCNWLPLLERRRIIEQKLNVIREMIAQ